MEHAIYTDILTAILLGIIGFMFWKMKQFEGQNYTTRKLVDALIEESTRQLNEKLREKTSHLESEYAKLEIKIDLMQEQLVNIGMTLARIDERMKKNSG